LDQTEKDLQRNIEKKAELRKNDAFKAIKEELSEIKIREKIKRRRVRDDTLMRYHPIQEVDFQRRRRKRVIRLKGKR
jgi:hypothetical protein